jgi:hypothetical protein
MELGVFQQREQRRKIGIVGTPFGIDSAHMVKYHRCVNAKITSSDVSPIKLRIK